ncbi:ribosomal L7Ae/L30e/S12e/Gadd45 family protein [Alloiococcus sp. CFN-8]|uniref:ribosomal L7Ae/L30e/S12e/Gadd45 family protein n=1 Tax=Alloiococcus sp. CFN-8 TaxID=3416081 RepID=UPI003CEE0932
MDNFLRFLSLTKKSGHLIEGYNNSLGVMNKKKIHLVIVSKELSSNSEKKFTNYCEAKNIIKIKAYSKEELGKALGRQEVKIVCITDENLAKKLISLAKEATQTKS